MVPMIMNSWDSRIKILINYFIGNEIFNKTPCRTQCIVCVFFNGINGIFNTCMPLCHIKEILSIRTT